MPPSNFKFADLHCHPSGKNFPRYYHGRKEDFQSEDAHLWTIPKSRWPALLKGWRGTKYSQSDIGNLVEHGGKLVFASIYPFEDGFVKRLSADGRDPSIGMVKMAFRYSAERIAFLRSNQVDYFSELQAEYEFLKRKSGQKASGQIVKKIISGINIYPGTQTVEGIYYLLTPNEDLENQWVDPWKGRSFLAKKNLERAIETPHCSVLVLTIEGMHALSMKNGSDGPVDEATLQTRINEIKTWPVFFMTFAHHFDNQLCAHAKSFFKPPLKWKPDQEKNMNCMAHIDMQEPLEADQPVLKGFSPVGFRAIQQLLSVRRLPDGKVEDAMETHGRRILIDTKHMSATARQDFYKEIIRPYNAAPGRRMAINHTRPIGCIPVIASHSAYSGVDTLEEMIRGYEMEDDNSKGNKGLNYWSINLSAEDVQIIVQSGGLIGLNLDQRILGIMYKMKLHHLLEGNLFTPRPARRRNNVRLIVDNILHMAEAIKKSGLGLHQYSPDANAHSFWNCICLGTDFDGGIDPVDAYSTVGDMEQLYRDMQTALENIYDKGLGKHFDTQHLSEFIPQKDQIGKVLNLFFWDNAHDFLVRHF